MNTIKEKRSEHERIMTFTMPFDKRSSIPEKDYGIGSMRIYMALIKNDQATSFCFSIPFFLPHVALGFKNPEVMFQGMGYEVNYHSPERIYSQQNEGFCSLLKDKKCFCGSSPLKAEEWYQEFLKQEEAFDIIWQKLESYWNDIFAKGTKK